MKASLLLTLVAAILAVFVNIAAAQTIITVKYGVASGPLSMASGMVVGPTAVDALDWKNYYTPAQATGVGRIFFGAKVTFPAEATITLSEVSYILRRDGNTTAWKSGSIPRWITVDSINGNPVFPFMAAYNTAGTKRSVENSFSVGTTLTGVKTIVIGNFRWTLGTNQPAQQPLLSAISGSSYAQAFIIRGTYNTGSGPVSFHVLPPFETVVGNDEVVHGYGVVGVRPDLTPEQWVAQLEPMHVVSGEGWTSYILKDPSRLWAHQDGFELSGMDWSTDLVNWYSLGDVEHPLNQSYGASGDTLTFNLESGSLLRFFVRGNSARVRSNGNSWWVPTPPSNS